MTTIHTILEEFRQLATSMPDLGGKFERLIKSYLLTDPTYKNLYSEVSLWNEWEYKWGSDTGIDLVARDNNTGDYCAIQCKFYDPNRTLDKGDIDSFFTTSGRKFMTKEGEKSFTTRLFVSTTDKWTKNAADALNNQLIPVTHLRAQNLENSKIDWSKFSVNYPQDIVLKPKNPIRPHQQTAVEKVAVSFETADRGKLIMACGTGKTFTSLKIAEKITPENSCILFLVPSISLLEQTLREWTAEANTPLHCLAVCSDDKVGKKADNEDISIHDLAFPATTNAHDLSKHISAAQDKRMVIFSTYQSIQVIADAQQQGLPEFDLIICDEAHRTTGITLDGKNEAHFVKVHDQDFIKAKKRLYMTATPRIFSAAIKAAAEERSVVIACMDNEQFFGQVFHHLTFKQAIADQLLTDYKVVIVGVDAPMIKAWIDQRELLKTDSGIETDAQTFAAHIGLMKVMQDYDLKRVISFHSRIKRAEDFAKEYEEMLHWVKAEHKPSGEIVTDYVSGKMNVADRTRKINQLKTIDDKEGMTGRMLLANARCLSEGIDVPDLDGVAFIDPRKSQVDIVQAVGRAIRRSNSKTHGIIVLPVFIGDGDNPQTELENSRYEPIWKVLDALRSHDDVLAEELDSFRTELGRDKSGSSGGFSKIVIDLPTTVGNGFVNALNVRIIEVTTASWCFWYGLLEKYIKEYGHARVPLKLKYEDFNLGKWVSHQRCDKDKLDLKRIKLLALPDFAG
jgi:predicted helicase